VITVKAYRSETQHASTGTRYAGGFYALCGAGTISTGTRRPSVMVKVADGTESVTCKRCRRELASI